MYNRADVGGGELGWGPVWGRCCMLGGGKLAEGSRRRGKEKEKERSRHVSYVMIIPKHRGRLSSALPRRRGRGGGAGLCFQTGVRSWEGTRKSRKEGYRWCRRGKIQKKEQKKRVKGRQKVPMMSQPPATGSGRSK